MKTLRHISSVIALSLSVFCLTAHAQTTAASSMHYGPPPAPSAASSMSYGPPPAPPAASSMHYGPPPAPPAASSMHYGPPTVSEKKKKAKTLFEVTTTQ